MCFKEFLREYSNHIIVGLVIIFIVAGIIVNNIALVTGIPTLIIVFYKFYLDELKPKKSKIKIKKDTSKNHSIDKWSTTNPNFHVLIGNEGERKAYIREINLKKITGKKNKNIHELTKKDLKIDSPEIKDKHETIKPKDFIPSRIKLKLKNEHKIYEKIKEKIKDYDSMEFKFSITVEDFQHIKYSVEISKTIYPKEEIAKTMEK